MSRRRNYSAEEKVKGNRYRLRSKCWGYGLYKQQEPHPWREEAPAVFACLNAKEAYKLTLLFLQSMIQ